MDTLLPTKLFIPLLELDLLTRARLLEELTAGRSAGLILVSAPAGSGKTTLIADWVRRGGLPTGWLSLDAADDDPWAFLGCLAEAYDALQPGVGDRVRAMLGAASPPAPLAITKALIADVTAAMLDGVIVLDDYHTLSDPVIHQVLSLLIERTPASPTLVVITRSDPPLPLPRLRVRRQLCEIREADLRFQQTEACAFIRQFSGRELSPESVAALAARTEGWAAGLQLASLALRQAADPDAFVAEFQGTHAFIADYLTDEVLASLPEAWQRFVVRTSLLHRISGPLCDAALERSGSQALLEELSRANLFMVPLDNERRWFRYHHLFADLLRRRSLEEESSEREALLARAADWCATNGAIEDAVTYASRAGATTLAADLVAQHGVQALAAGEAYRALRWVNLLPDEMVRASPEHCVIAGWAYSQQERYSPIAELSRRALELAGEGERPHPHVDDVEQHARLLLAGAELLDGGSARTALETIDQVLATTSSTNLPVRATAEVMNGKLLAFRGDYEAALEAHARARELGLRANSDLLRLAGVAGLAETLLAQGRLRAAIEVVTEEIVSRRSLRETLGSQVANLHAIQALAHLERGEDTAAAESLRHCRQALGDDGARDPGVAHDRSSDEWPPAELFGRVRLTAFHSSAATAFYGLEVQFRLLLRRGEYTDAERILGRWETAVQAGTHPVVRTLIDSLRVRLLSAAGERTGLRRVQPRDTNMPTGSIFWDDARRLTAARAALASSDPLTAHALMAALLGERAGGHSRLGLEESAGGHNRLEFAETAAGARLGLADAFVLHALAAAALGRPDQAARSTISALELTAPEHRIAVWLDVGSAVVPLLEAAVLRRDASPEAIAHAIALLAELRDRTGAGAGGAVVILSERELAVLHLLAAGHTNSEIGQALFLALGTVKKHTHNIYTKLGVANRTRAVQAARERGLILEAALPTAE
jgi:LuxR family maltose regulon positive regulatory protein